MQIVVLKRTAGGRSSLLKNLLLNYRDWRWNSMTHVKDPQSLTWDVCRSLSINVSATIAMLTWTQHSESSPFKMLYVHMQIGRFWSRILFWKREVVYGDHNSERLPRRHSFRVTQINSAVHLCDGFLPWSLPVVFRQAENTQEGNKTKQWNTW